MRNIFNYYYYGICCEFISNNDLFSNLMKNKFSGFTQKKDSKELLEFSAKITFKKVNNFSKKDLTTIYSDTISISKDLKSVLIKKYYLNAMSQTTISLSNKLEINIEYKPSFLFKILNLFSGNILEQQFFQNTIKTNVEQILLHLIVSKKKLLCLHAAAIEKDGKVILFAGLNGVGKSTLAQYLIKNSEYSYFGDNYVLVDSKKVYKSPDTVRLSEISRKYLNISISNKFGFGKNNVKNIYLSSFNVADTSNIYFVSRGQKYSNKKGSLHTFELIKKLQLIENEEVTNSKLSYLLNDKNDFKFNHIVKFNELTLSSFKDLEKFKNEL